MSSTATGTHPLAAVAGATDALLDYYVRDMKAIPSELFDVSPMGCARSPLAITIEIIGVNFAVASILKGGGTVSETDAMARYAHIKSKDEAEGELIASVKALNEAALGLSPEEIGAPVVAPWGQEMPKGRLYTTLSYHIMYHDGQLNYFQCLHGDAENHWHD